MGEVSNQCSVALRLASLFHQNSWLFHNSTTTYAHSRASSQTHWYQSQSINPSQSMTINSDLVAHLVKLIPGRREKWFLCLLAEWHEAWKFLSDNPNYYLWLSFLSLLLLESNYVSFYPPLWGRTGAWFILLVSLLLLLSVPISVVDGCFWFVATKQVVSGLLQPALVRPVAQSPTNWAEASPKTCSPPHSYRVGWAFWSRI